MESQQMESAIANIGKANRPRNTVVGKSGVNAMRRYIAKNGRQQSHMKQAHKMASMGY